MIQLDSFLKLTMRRRYKLGRITYPMHKPRKTLPIDWAKKMKWDHENFLPPHQVRPCYSDTILP